MTHNLKTEIEKINQEIKDEEDEEWREVLKERKQGLIQGAKMMKDELFKKFDEYACIKNDQWYLDFKQQLNNWLEKENE